MLEQILKILQTDNVFLTGGGGVGKSYISSAIIAHYKKELKNVVVLGSTGIAAVNVGGVSVHSFFKFGISASLEELSLLDAKQRQGLAKVRSVLDSCDLLVIDEVSMISAQLMEMIHYRLRTSKFVGRILLVGDFYQLAPVQSQKHLATMTQNSLFSAQSLRFTYAFSSAAWAEFELVYVELRHSKRTKDSEFYSILNRLRLGKLDESLFSYLENLRVPAIVPDANSSVLFGKNSQSDAYNIAMLKQLQTKPIDLQAKVEVYDERLSKEALERWVRNLNAPLNLSLKIGAEVMFVTNKWGEYYNGERARIVDVLSEDMEISALEVQKQSGERLLVKRHSFSLSEFVTDQEGDVIEDVRASFLQFPFKLAYAITIHKSQGMSISNLTCDLNNIFANGQLYVALSRATSSAGLRLFYERKQSFKDYISSVVLVDEEVVNFYNNNKFIKE